MGKLGQRGHGITENAFQALPGQAGNPVSSRAQMRDARSVPREMPRARAAMASSKTAPMMATVT